MSTASLTARGPEDILAYIAHAIGFWPQDSLVCLTAQSTRIGATLRVDLPDRSLKGEPLLGYVRAVLGYLEHDRSADGTFVALFQNTSVAAARKEHAELMALLAWVLGQAGRPVHELWLVGTDGWNGSGCRGSVCSLTGNGPCDDGGPHPLDLIRDSRLAAELVYQGSAVEQHPGRGARSEGPPRRTAPGRTDRPPRDRPSPADASGTAPKDGPSLAAVLECWEPYLDGAVAWNDRTDTETRRTLRRSLDIPALRDAVYVSAGSSWSTAYRGGLAAEAVLSEAGGQRSTSHVPWKGDPWLDRFGHVFLAEGETGPEWDRMNRFGAMLREMLHEAGERPAAGVLTGLAWVEWCRGRGTQASAYLDRALAEDPGHRLASLLNRAVLSGALSGWASKRHSSWRRPLDGEGHDPRVTG